MSNKNLTYLVAMLLITIAISSCSSTPEEKTLSVKNVQISGDCADYMKVLDGDYTLKVIEDGESVQIPIKIELTKEYPDSVKMIGSMGMGFDLQFMDKDGATINISPAFVEGENSKVTAMLNNDKPGKQITVTFKLSSLGNAEDVKRIMEESVSFEITGADIYQEKGASQSTLSESAATSFSSDLADGNIDDVLSTYESFIDDYASMVKSAANGDISVLSDAASMLSRAQTMQQQLNDQKGSMTAEQARKLTKISSKMLKAASDIGKYSTKDAEKAAEDIQKQADEMMRKMGM